MLDVIEKENLIQHADHVGQLLMDGARELAEKYQVKSFNISTSYISVLRLLETFVAGDSSSVSIW